MPVQDVKPAPKLALDVFGDRRAAFLNVLTRRLGNRADAEEVLQDAYLLFDQARSKTDITNPEAYFMRIAVNLSTDRIRQDASRRKREKNWVELENPTTAAPETTVPFNAPDRVLAAKDELAHILRLIEGLSPSVRQAFLLHKIKGLSHKETADTLNLSKSTVEKHIMKAMRYLLDRMPDRGG